MSLRVVTAEDVAGKRVVCRFDFNVPTEGPDENGLYSIRDTNKIDQALPTLQLLLTAGANHVTLLSHLGQPKQPAPEFSLAPVARYLAQVFHAAEPSLEEGSDGGLAQFSINDHITLLENVAFNQGESENDPALVKKYSNYGEVFVFDAFASAHRAYASRVGVMDLLPSFAGLLVEKELQFLQAVREDPKHPFVMLVGGAKIEDKLPVIERLASHVDTFLVGGAVANTFLKAKGMDVKQSLVNEDCIADAKRILSEFDDKIVLPSDHVWNNDAIEDIGPRTIMQFEDHLTDALTVLWNGNLGKTEERSYSRGSLALGDFISRLTSATRVIAGGDTGGFLQEHHMSEAMTFVSTGGGATLDYLAGKPMPALEKLGAQALS